jgi:aspartate aminotransferase-like enzyme
MNASFLTGPVTVSPAVRAAFGTPPISHRTPEFIESMRRTRAALTSLVSAPHVALMVGSGTLANDAVAAQLASIDEPGLILANGEFGERLVDHARRWNVEFTVERRAWGVAFDWREVRRTAENTAPAWIWAVLTETSTGVANPLRELRALSDHAGAALCLDAVSAIGLTPVDLQGVRFATAVSGKGLAAFPGLAAVFHDGRIASSERVPRYLDLSGYEASEGVPFTHSSNLVAALECSLSLTDWPRKFERVAAESRWLRAEMRRLSMLPIAHERDAAAGILTLEIPGEACTADVARALAKQGIEIAWQSGYLIDRNWMQVALMGDMDEAALRALPGALAGCVERLAARHFRDEESPAISRRGHLSAGSIQCPHGDHR